MKEIKLQNGMVALVDDEDYCLLSRHKWYCQRGYAVAKVGRRDFYMHRMIFVPANGKTADHVNRNRLDNRKQNLRSCTPSQNMANRPRGIKRIHPELKYQGVRINDKSDRYGATITFKHKKYSLGSYATIEEAAKAYDKKAIELYGEFAQLNFPDCRYAALIVKGEGEIV